MATKAKKETPAPDPEPEPPKEPESNDIDSRMAALLKDHQAMGARPLQEPVTVDKAG